jgi:hypothetical protein
MQAIVKIKLDSFCHSAAEGVIAALESIAVEELGIEPDDSIKNNTLIMEKLQNKDFNIKHLPNTFDMAVLTVGKNLLDYLRAFQIKLNPEFLEKINERRFQGRKISKNYWY